MSFLEAIILGVVQGLTEFIPVSSSGHLVLIHKLFNAVSTQDLSVDAILQLATVLAVFVYFRKDILNLIKTFFKIIFGRKTEEYDRNFLLAIILGTIPAVILGLLLESFMETTFRNIYLVVITLILGSLLMYFADRSKKENNSAITAKKGFVVGLFQTLALIPGVSRSGATISGSLLSGLNRTEATRFAFILSFPIIFGSGLKKLFDLYSSGGLFSIGAPLLLSFILAFCFGIFAIHFLLKYLRKHNLNIFIWYRVVLAVAIILTAL